MEYDKEYTIYFLYLTTFWLLAISSGTFVYYVIKSVYESLLYESIFKLMSDLLSGVYTIILYIYIAIVVSPIFIFWDLTIVSLFFSVLFDILLVCALCAHTAWGKGESNV